jgi:hypothetical protein
MVILRVNIVAMTTLAIPKSGHHREQKRLEPPFLQRITKRNIKNVL